jgi:hypothetical protein
MYIKCILLALQAQAICTYIYFFCKQHLARFVMRFCQNQTRFITSTQNFQYNTAKNQDSSISSTATRLRAGRPRKSGLILARGERFFSSPSVQAPSGVHPASCSMAHLCLVLTSTISIAIPPCHMQGQLIFTASYCQHKDQLVTPAWAIQHITAYFTKQQSTYSTQPAGTSCLYLYVFEILGVTMTWLSIWT